jgi:hypothetical protein
MDPGLDEYFLPLLVLLIEMFFIIAKAVERLWHVRARGFSEYFPFSIKKKGEYWH